MENRSLKDEMKNVALKASEIKGSTDKVRRCLFGKNAELQKRITELEFRLQVLEKNICTGVI